MPRCNFHDTVPQVQMQRRVNEEGPRVQVWDQGQGVDGPLCDQELAVEGRHQGQLYCRSCGRCVGNVMDVNLRIDWATHVEERSVGYCSASMSTWCDWV